MFYFSLNLKDEGKRPESFKIAEKLREKFKNFQAGKLSVIEQSGGPPVGSDVQIKLLGDDLSILNSKADEVSRYLENQQGVTNVEKSIKSGTSKLVFTPDASLLADKNITIDQLGGFLRLYASGINFKENKFPGENEKQDITLRLYDERHMLIQLIKLIFQPQMEMFPLHLLEK